MDPIVCWKKKIYIAPYIDNRRFACLSVAYNEMIQANKKNTPYRYLSVRCFCCCGFFRSKEPLDTSFHTNDWNNSRFDDQFCGSFNATICSLKIGTCEWCRCIQELGSELHTLHVLILNINWQLWNLKVFVFVRMHFDISFRGVCAGLTFFVGRLFWSHWRYH